MLTVDFDRLSVEPGHRVLDMGAGAGRHAFEALRRGATIVAFDYSFPELKTCMGTYFAMLQKSEIPEGGIGTAVRGTALDLPFPDGSFDRIIASEVLEHIDDDGRAAAELFRVLSPGGRIAVTVPSWFPEQICWKLSDEYHAPKSVGGHVRIYKASDVADLLGDTGFELHGHHRAHALHSPYWWLKCAVGPTNNNNPLVKKYLKLLEWDIVEAPRSTRLADRILNPIFGKSIVHYAAKRSAAETAQAGANHAAA
ncbi:MAG: class I SAM-dependent methyltransferase [Actinomycetia bacterium]|nr:class I SAM-dependent methyltransferase [Actinomycetes bacterium]MCP4961843.1 class I SAM-dependent methyltransferase [Actinomycetes bacterium]